MKKILLVLGVFLTIGVFTSIIFYRGPIRCVYITDVKGGCNWIGLEYTKIGRPYDMHGFRSPFYKIQYQIKLTGTGPRYESPEIIGSNDPQVNGDVLVEYDRGIPKIVVLDLNESLIGRKSMLHDADIFHSKYNISEIITMKGP